MAPSDLSLLLPVAAAALAVLALVAAVWVSVRHARLLRQFLGALTEADVRTGLARLAAGLDPLEGRLDRLEGAQRAIAQRVPDRLGPPGVVHFQAYGNAGPALSFSIALVNEHNDGIVLTSLHGRDQVRLFLKPIAAGSSDADLADEEREALALAQHGGGARTLAELPSALPRALRKGRG